MTPGLLIRKALHPFDKLWFIVSAAKGQDLIQECLWSTINTHANSTAVDYNMQNKHQENYKPVYFFGCNPGLHDEQQMQQAKSKGCLPQPYDQGWRGVSVLNTLNIHVQQCNRPAHQWTRAAAQLASTSMTRAAPVQTYNLPHCPMTFYWTRNASMSYNYRPAGCKDLMERICCWRSYPQLFV